MCKSKGAYYILLPEHQFPMPKSALSNIYSGSVILFTTLRLRLAEVGQEGVTSDVIVFLGTEQHIVTRQARQTRKPHMKSTSIHGE